MIILLKKRIFHRYLYYDIIVDYSEKNLSQCELTPLKLLFDLFIHFLSLIRTPILGHFDSSSNRMLTYLGSGT